MNDPAESGAPTTPRSGLLMPDRGYDPGRFAPPAPTPPRVRPLPRIMGFLALAGAVALHNVLILGTADAVRLLAFGFGATAYALLSLGVLHRAVRRGRRAVRGGVHVLDTVVLALAVYLTGGPASRLFWVFLLRPAPATPSWLRRVLGGVLPGVVGYAGVVAYAVVVEGRSVAWELEAARLAVLALGGLYLAARAAPETETEAPERGLQATLDVANLSIQSLRERAGALFAALEEAEAGSLDKSHFLARLAREIRGPLNGILELVRLLETDALRREQRVRVEELGEIARHLLDVTNEVADIARVETGSLARQLRPVHLMAALSDVLDRARPPAERRQVSLPPEPPADADVWVQGNDRKLRQVFANLVSNAIKYNQSPGHIAIGCDLRGARVRVSVTDTGPGIPRDRLVAAFAPFDRLGAERTGVKGTGLGLTLSRALMEAMNGRIGVDTEPDGGSTFWVELDRTEPPADAGNDASRAPVEDRRVGSLRVLYVARHADVIMRVRRTLARHPGVGVISVPADPTAIPAALDRRPDVVLADVDPAADGADVVLEAVRSAAAARGTPVIRIAGPDTPVDASDDGEAQLLPLLRLPDEAARLPDVLDELLAIR